MKIAGGRWRGRRLDAGPDASIRPTGDRMRQALFNILAHGPAWRRAEGPLPLDAQVLDAFAGSGAMGMEALSRGAARALFLERDPAACDLIRRNLAGLSGLPAGAGQVLRRDATAPGTPPAGFAADLAFLDPPYGQGLAERALPALLSGGWLRPGAAVVVETGAGEPLVQPEGFILRDERRYGIARALFLQAPQ